MFARRMLSALLLGALTFSAFAVSAQEKKAPEKKSSPAKKAAPAMDEKAMMDAMMKIATPGPGHKKLDFMVGAWRAKISMFMDPTKPPAISEGTSAFKWILGGRYMEQTVDSTWMGQPFSGIGHTAYDNFKKKYVSTWMDNAGTMIMIASGNFDSAGKVLTYTGRMDDPTQGKNVPFREKMTVKSNDEFLFEMFSPGPDGKEIRNMEIIYTRKK